MLFRPNIVFRVFERLVAFNLNFVTVPKQRPLLYSSKQLRVLPLSLPGVSRGQLNIPGIFRGFPGKQKKSRAFLDFQGAYESWKDGEHLKDWDTWGSRGVSYSVPLWLNSIPKPRISIKNVLNVYQLTIKGVYKRT